MTPWERLAAAVAGGGQEGGGGERSGAQRAGRAVWREPSCLEAAADVALRQARRAKSRPGLNLVLASSDGRQDAFRVLSLRPHDSSPTRHVRLRPSRWYPGGSCPPADVGTSEAD